MEAGTVLSTYRRQRIVYDSDRYRRGSTVTTGRLKHAANLFHGQTDFQDVSVSPEDFVRSVNLRKIDLGSSLTEQTSTP